MRILFAHDVMGQSNPVAQPPFHFRFIGIGKLMSNTLARHVAGQFMQVERDFQSLLARHLAVSLDLTSQGFVRFHHSNLIQKVMVLKFKTLKVLFSVASTDLAS